jgi:RHS repeat-associated protein
VTAGGVTSQYVYDAEGRRVRATSSSGATTRYILDTVVPNARVIAEQDASRTPIATYTYGHEIISMERNGETYYYVLDAHGSVRALTDAQGNVTDTYAYTAFGELASRTGTTVNPFAYAGEQLDADTGLYFLRARYYDPSTGRFTQWDAFPGTEEQPQSRNRYAYAFNNPVNVVDPSGRVGEGNAEHKEIGLFYILRHGDYYYMRLKRKTNKGFPILDRLNYGWGAFDRKIRGMPSGDKRAGKQGSKPDLRHYSTGEVHEIKPLNLDGWKDAPVQALNYAGWLNYYETDNIFPGEGLPEWSVGKSWATWPPFFKLGGLTTFGPPFTPDGAILYSRNWVEDVELLLKAARGVQKLTTNTINLLRAMRLIRKAPNLIRDVNMAQMEQDRLSAMRMPASSAFFFF